MSRKTKQWKRAIRQAGGAGRVIPQRATGTGTWLGGGSGNGTVCTRDPKPETVTRFRLLEGKKK